MYRQSPNQLISNALFDFMDFPASYITTTTNNMEKEKSNFPPYNIIDFGNDSYRIDIGVSGYTQEDLSIIREGNILYIRAKGQEEEPNVKYLYKKLARRAFKLDFFMGKHIEVVDTYLENGILSIGLKKSIPEELKPQVIKIEGKRQIGLTNVDTISSATVL